MSLGPVAWDGTKIRANASTHTARSYGRMKAAAPALAAEVALDARADATYGVDRRGDERPEWGAHKPQRWEKIRAAKAAVEADAEATARKEAATSDRPRRGRPATHLPGMPPDRAPRHFTDPDSRIMQAREGFIQGDTAPAAGDAAHQVIVAQGLTNQAGDAHPLEPMLAHSRCTTGRQARELSAEAGYCSEHNLTAWARRHGSAPARRGLGRRQTHDRPEDASPRDDDPPDTRRVSQSLSFAKAGGRTRVWPDQTGAGFQAVLVAGPVAGRW